MINFKAILPQIKQSSWWLGILLVSLIAGISALFANLSFFQNVGLSVMTLSIVIGIIMGNTIFPFFASKTSVGVDYAKNILLRAGIIIYGFRITFQQITGIGWSGILIDILVVSSTFLLAIVIGQLVLKMDKQTTILIGAGSSICGAAAVMATEPVVNAPAYKVSIAVATVVIFGTVSLFLYPFLYHYLDLSQSEFGVYVGSTIHEVAQVVAASKNISEQAAESAVIVKMIRVMLLVPFLILLSLVLNKETRSHSQTKVVTIPWFAVFFIGASILNSLHIIPTDWLPMLNQVSTLLLASAMAALGLRTHISMIKQAGLKPLLLAAILFVFLTVGGYGINILVNFTVI